MAIHLSGPISFQDLVDEFSTGKPLRLSQMFRGAGYVPMANAGVPINGPISLGDFYGATAAYVLNYNITADMLNFNSTTILNNSGWDGVLPAVLTINISNGIVVSGDNVNTPALVINALPAGSQVFLNNNGYIVGMGGRGGVTTSYAAAGEKGGDAIQVNSGVAVSINNQGTIAGGGGGSGGYRTGFNSSGGGGGQSGRVASAGGSSPARAGSGGTFTGPGSVGGSGKVFGGTWGNAGSNSTAAGGAGGKAVVGNSYITWITTGTINGAIT